MVSHYRQLRDLRLWGWVLFVPISLLWGFAAFVRRRLYPAAKRYRSRVPVICIGNIHSGGSGKTPVVEAVSRHYRASIPAIVTRGYGGRLSDKGGKVDLTAANGALLFGDEPWMLAQRIEMPVYVGRNRRASISEIEKSDARLIVMDDGFQHLAVQSSLSCVCVNAERSPEDSFCLPAGDLRESWSAVLDASCVLLLHRGFYERWSRFFQENYPGVKVFPVEVAQSLPGDLAEESLGAFCGIANPEVFESDLRKVPNVKWLGAFRDHHVYSRKDVEGLVSRGDAMGVSSYLTTAKDAVKVAPHFRALGKRLVVAEIECRFPREFWSFVDERMGLAA